MSAPRYAPAALINFAQTALKTAGLQADMAQCVALTLVEGDLLGQQERHQQREGNPRLPPAPTCGDQRGGADRISTALRACLDARCRAAAGVG